MEIKKSENKEAWNSWLALNTPRPAFGQSFEWGEILRGEGKETEYLSLESGGTVLGQALVYYYDLPFGRRYAFCPQGPILKDERGYDILADYFKAKKCIFFRLETMNLPKAFSLVKTIDINPRATLILDLAKSEEELLAGMHQKTRYNIHLAAKKNLKIVEKKDFDILMKLMSETGARDKFKLHYPKHYREVLISPLASQLVAYLDNEAVATVVLIGFGNTFTYLYGASSYAHRPLMAPYLLQWEAIKLGKKLGYKYYDFFGVAPGFNSKHQYAGVTRFKQGFGGEYVESPGTYDLIFDKKQYKIYRLLRFIRRLI